MEMSIDEAIKRMGDIRKNYDNWSGLGLTHNEDTAFDMAIETMHKYQQIEQALDSWTDGVLTDRQFVSAVRKVGRW